MKPPTEILLESHLPGLGVPKRGKVRDIYDLGDALLLVATDRISAFDVILPDGIPGKGYVLTQLSLFWFEWLSKMTDGVPHHLLTADVDSFPEQCLPYREILDGRSMVVRKAKPLLVECIVRGYISGSGWKAYCKGGAISGEKLPENLVESSLLPYPIFTPSTKGEIGVHDVTISFNEMKAMVGELLSEEIREICVRIYKEASSLAEAKGIIIADTKMEFGLDPATGRLMLIDELLTPDSSRFWPRAAYLSGRGQPSFDKQYVRDYLLSMKWDGKGPAPYLPQAVIEQTSHRYFEALERLTGVAFVS